MNLNKQKALVILVAHARQRYQSPTMCLLIMLRVVEEFDIPLEAFAKELSLSLDVLEQQIKSAREIEEKKGSAKNRSRAALRLYLEVRELVGETDEIL